MTPRRIAAAMVAASLLFAACGSSDDGATTTDSFAYSAEELEATAVAQKAAEQAGATTAPVDAAAAWATDLSDTSPASRDGFYPAAAPMTIDQDRGYVATVVTDKGKMRFRLYDDEAPVTVNNFVSLANAGFYDGLSFHRVLESFMAQGGDPSGTGGGGPGYEFVNEYTPGIEFDRRGQLAMANAGVNTNGSQFFITFNGENGLPANLYTIFGQLLEGDDVLDTIRLREPSSDPAPGDIIETIRVEVTDFDAPIERAERPTGAGDLDPVARDGFYPFAAEMTIDPEKTYTAVLKTANGEMRFELYPAESPITVNNFVALAEDGFYDGVTFHRVLEDFMAQGGDPSGTGGGGPGYQFVNEYTPGLEFDQRGQLAMANAGPNTNGSQFFITFDGDSGLPADQYTIFGQLTEGDDVLSAINLRDPQTGPTDPGDLIESITIEVS